MTVVRWELTDTVLSEVYVFPINPSEGGSPSYRKNMAYVNTSALDGSPIVFEGSTDPPRVEFVGKVLEQSHYEELKTWFNKRYPIYIKDDINRINLIYITDADFRRERSFLYPWKHSYTISCIILEEDAVIP